MSIRLTTTMQKSVPYRFTIARMISTSNIKVGVSSARSLLKHLSHARCLQMNSLIVPSPCMESHPFLLQVKHLNTSFKHRYSSEEKRFKVTTFGDDDLMHGLKFGCENSTMYKAFATNSNDNCDKPEKKPKSVCFQSEDDACKIKKTRIEDTCNKKSGPPPCPPKLLHLLLALLAGLVLGFLLLWLFCSKGKKDEDKGEAEE